MREIQTLLESLKDAAWSGHGAVIGAGRYSPQDCKALAERLAAFPAMLAALQEIGAEIEAWADDENENGAPSANELAARIAVKARGAIALATGGPTGETGAAAVPSPFPRIAAQGERFTYWEVSRGVFNVSRDAPGGYGSPEALAKLKGDTIKPATGEH